MDDRFLLYIDILGFSEMTHQEPRKVARVYSILDTLNVHKNSTFKTIVFSDTVLVYNPLLADDDEKRRFAIWYLIEFAEDLHHRLTGQDIFFRAILTAGQFSHYSLKNIECFFGEALVNAHTQEKNIPSTGLFIDNTSNRYNSYFETEKFDSNFNFVYLNRHLKYLEQFTGGYYPSKEMNLVSDYCPLLPWQVRFLQDIHKNMREHPSPTVRAKFLTTWDFYARKYPAMTTALLQNNFSLSALAPMGAWEDEVRQMNKSIKYYKRIGSGTSLSVEMSQGKLNRRSMKG